MPTNPDLPAILPNHGAFLRGEAGGVRADLRKANLHLANLRKANLRLANLRDAVLCRADLRGAVLCRADLRRANLRGSKVYGVRWPAPTAVLLAEWGELSDDLTRDLMRFDAWCHPDPSRFDAWANGGPCPYDDVRVQRVANFTERKELWTPGMLRKRPKSPYELMTRILEECCDNSPGENDAD